MQRRNVTGLHSVFIIADVKHKDQCAEIKVRQDRESIYLFTRAAPQLIPALCEQTLGSTRSLATKHRGRLKQVLTNLLTLTSAHTAARAGGRIVSS